MEPVALASDIQAKIADIRELEARSGKEKPEKARRLMAQAMDAVRDQALAQYAELDPRTKKSEQSRQEARESAAQILTGLKNALDRNIKNLGKPSFDPEPILQNYARGYYQLLVGCPTRDPGQTPLPDGDPSDRGALGCPVLAGKDQEVQGFFTVDFPGGEQTVQGWRQFLSGGVMTSYIFNPQRTYAGAGGTLEFLVPWKRNPLVAFGGEASLLALTGFDEPKIFNAELKTVEAMLIPLTLEAGYQGEGMTVLLQAGMWFSGSRLFNAEQEKDPYADNIFDNLASRIGLKAYLFDHLRVSGGWQQDPWEKTTLYSEVGWNF